MRLFTTSEYRMLFVTGVLCYLIMIVGAIMLNQLPVPDEKDKEYRTERT